MRVARIMGSHASPLGKSKIFALDTLPVNRRPHSEPSLGSGRGTSVELSVERSGGMLPSILAEFHRRTVP